MKKILLLSTILAGSFFIYKPAVAQFQASVNFGVQQPGYEDAENYYLPDAEAYYSVPRHQFVYFDNGNWVFSSSLPGRCENFESYAGCRVVMNERNPWFHFNDHRIRYADYRSGYGREIIRDNRGYARSGEYGRSGFGDRNRGRDWGFNRSNDHENRQDWGNARRHGFDNSYRHDDHEGRGRGRW